MKSKQIDYLNIGLIGISLLLAYVFPFKLFIYSYAILGPLHYLTEINWLREKNYFVNERRWVWIAGACAFLLVIPLFFLQTSLSNLMEYEGLEKVILFGRKWSNTFVLLPFVLAIGFALFRKWRFLMMFLVVGIVLAISLNEFTLYGVLIGTMLPTMLHVYVFTVLFMLFGALKSKSKVGIWAVVVALMVPIVIISNPVDPGNYLFGDAIKQIYTDNNWHSVNAQIAMILGQGDGTKFFFYESLFLKVQIFIAFAYTYHYLNWFSKTTIIGWHKQLTKKRSLVIVGIWLIAISLYAYDYKLGLLWLLFLSLLHVFLEFPLNILSIRGIGEALVKKEA